MLPTTSNLGVMDYFYSKALVLGFDTDSIVPVSVTRKLLLLLLL
jgi:hypothetical protein